MKALLKQGGVLVLVPVSNVKLLLTPAPTDTWF